MFFNVCYKMRQNITGNLIFIYIYLRKKQFLCYSQDFLFLYNYYRISTSNQFVKSDEDDIVNGETFYINFYYSIFQIREKRITLRILVSRNTKLYNNDMKLQHSS